MEYVKAATAIRGHVDEFGQAGDEALRECLVQIGPAFEPALVFVFCTVTNSTVYPHHLENMCSTLVTRFPGVDCPLIGGTVTALGQTGPAGGATLHKQGILVAVIAYLKGSPSSSPLIHAEARVIDEVFDREMDEAASFAYPHEREKQVLRKKGLSVELERVLSDLKGPTGLHTPWNGFLIAILPGWKSVSQNEHRARAEASGPVYLERCIIGEIHRLTHGLAPLVGISTSHGDRVAQPNDARQFLNKDDFSNSVVLVYVKSSLQFHIGSALGYSTDEIVCQDTIEHVEASPSGSGNGIRGLRHTSPPEFIKTVRQRLSHDDKYVLVVQAPCEEAYCIRTDDDNMQHVYPEVKVGSQLYAIRCDREKQSLTLRRACMEPRPWREYTACPAFVLGFCCRGLLDKDNTNEMLLRARRETKSPIAIACGSGEQTVLDGNQKILNMGAVALVLYDDIDSVAVQRLFVHQFLHDLALIEREIEGSKVSAQESLKRLRDLVRHEPPQLRRFPDIGFDIRNVLRSMGMIVREYSEGRIGPAIPCRGKAATCAYVFSTIGGDTRTWNVRIRWEGAYARLEFRMRRNGECPHTAVSAELALYAELQRWTILPLSEPSRGFAIQVPVAW